ncbi:Hypothetical protein J6891_04668 [Nakaseomyces glabratus]
MPHVCKAVLQPSVVTRTVSESDGVVDTVVISYFPSVGEDGVTRTVTSTVSTHHSGLYDDDL